MRAERIADLGQRQVQVQLQLLLPRQVAGDFAQTVHIVGKAQQPRRDVGQHAEGVTHHAGAGDLAEGSDMRQAGRAITGLEQNIALFRRALFEPFEQLSRLFKRPGFGAHRKFAQIRHCLFQFRTTDFVHSLLLLRRRVNNLSADINEGHTDMSQSDTNASPWSAQDALVAMMVAVSIADQNIKTVELLSIERIVNHLPIFTDYDADHLSLVSTAVFDLMEEEDGLDALFGLVKDALPPKLFETAYALCCDVAASDGRLRETELRFLQETRYELNIDRLRTAAIEWGARARHMRA